MTAEEARRAIEALRKGIPPTGLVRQFTVGRRSEIEELERRLSSRESGALLLRANYGSGKTHMLRYIHETALQQNYIVSFVTLDANADVRFSQMDQIAGAVVRELEVPGGNTGTGLEDLLNVACAAIQRDLRDGEQGWWYSATLKNRWETTYEFSSYALFVALRAWYFTRDRACRNRIVDWLSQPWVYRTQGSVLYKELVEDLRGSFREQKTLDQLKAAGVFDFKSLNYQHSCELLPDLERLDTAAGFSGIVVLFDEFESTLADLRTRKPRQDAFQNLFDFFGGRRFTGASFFAVTPDFVQTCKDLLRERRILDYDYGAFERLSMFQMSPIEAGDLMALAQQIVDTHAVAYAWSPDGVLQSPDFRRELTDIAGSVSATRTRNFVERVIELCDDKIA
jgi:hypothetical protein